MCGISGIINLSYEPVSHDMIERMTDIIKHRGPNGYGYYFDNNVAFGHRRLSIIDLSEAGNQPMFFDDKYVIVFNGEIYNYLEIKNELKIYGYVFLTNSDTEVILASYHKWGKECVSKFNGMWSFAIHDKVDNIIFCSRDRFGEKPFYYTRKSNYFIFGSEIKQLLIIEPRVLVNKKVMLDYLVLGLEEYSDSTFFEGIQKLLPSHNLIYHLENNSIEIEKYYTIQIDLSIQDLTENESKDLYKSEFERSVKFRLRSDVKVGTCLSGGLDSSSVAAVASDLYFNSTGEKFAAITAKSEDSKNDESSYAQMVVDKLDLDWHLVYPNANNFREVLDEVIKTQEEPFGSPSIVMQYFVMEEAKNISSTVLLDGQGGDETLLGYERYYPAYLLSLPIFKRLLEFFNSSKNSKLSKKKLLLFIFYFLNPKIRINRQLNRFSFVKKKYLNLISKDIIIELSKSYSNIKQLQLLEITKTQLPHLLKYEDKNSMRHSIETRLPFLDYKLVELSLSINNNYKIKMGWTKFILRKTTEDKLPKEISWRKNKYGFEAPSSIWLKDKKWMLNQINDSKILREIILEKVSEKNDLNVLWKLFNIARWEKIYHVEID
jgi:asparagine synthase (glutamine-hydrolysing)